MNNIQKYGQYIIMILLLILVFRTCGVGSDVKRLTKDVAKLEMKLDSTTGLIITDSEMVKIIHTTPAWTTLEIEELSDKNKIPISAYKNKMVSE